MATEFGENLDTGSENELDTDFNNSGSGSLGIALTLLPLSVAAVYAFLEKAATLTAIESLLGGASGLALAVTNALWAVGLLFVALLALFGVIIVWSLFIAVVKQSIPAGIIGMLGVAWAGASYYLGAFLFPSVHVLIAFMIASNLIIMSAIFIVGGLAVLLGLALA